MEERKRSIWFIIGASIVLSIGIMMVIADDIESKIQSGSTTILWGNSLSNSTIWSNGSYDKILIHGNLNITNNCSAIRYFGDGSFLTGISGGSLPEYWKASLINTTIYGNSSYNKLLIKANTNITGNTIITGNCNATKFYGNGSKISNIGGYYGLNIESLSSAKTLYANVDKIYQHLDPNGNLRIITLATTGVNIGDTFIIRNTDSFGDSPQLQINQGATLLDNIYASSTKSFIWNGANWLGSVEGSGTGTASDQNLCLGTKSKAYTYGTAIGYLALGFNRGVAIGNTAYAYYRNTAIGYNAQSLTLFGANALGYYSKPIRTSETSIMIGNEDDTDQENNIVIIGWAKDTTTATPTEIFCGDISNQRCTIRPNSILAFEITVTGLNSTYTDSCLYKFTGIIKRNATSNTIMVQCNKTINYETTSSWDCNVTADDTNEALKITVTGQLAHTIQWVARLDGVETHF